MTAVNPSPNPTASPPPTGPNGRVATVGRASSTLGPWHGQVGQRGSTTPAMLTTANVGLVALIALFGAAATIVGVLWSNAARASAENTAPALITVQNMYASVAEANTEAAASHLAVASGADGRRNRGQYLAAVEQAAALSENVSATIGDDPNAHQAMQDINRALTEFSGRIEAARVLNERGIPEADAELESALELIGTDFKTSVQAVNDAGAAKLDAERSSASLVGWLALGLGVAAVAALILLQLRLVQRTNRLISPGLLAATICTAAVLAWLVFSSTTRASILASANDDGFQSIVATSAVQADLYQAHSDLTLQVIQGESQSDAQLDPIEEAIDGLWEQADTRREQSAIELLQARWATYREASERISTLAATDSEAAAEEFLSSGVSSFNGVNTMVESALSDNRRQLQFGVDQAARAVRFVPWAAVALTALGAVLVVVAIQRRLGEYR